MSEKYEVIKTTHPENSPSDEEVTLCANVTCCLPNITCCNYICEEAAETDRR